MEFDDSNTRSAGPIPHQKPESPTLLSFWQRLDQSSRLILDLPNSTAEQITQLRTAILSYDQFAKEEILVEHDHFKLIGQDNHRRYLPASPLRIRVHAEDKPWDIAARCSAAISANCQATLSYPDGTHEATCMRLKHSRMNGQDGLNSWRKAMLNLSRPFSADKWRDCGLLIRRESRRCSTGSKPSSSIRCRQKRLDLWTH